MTISVDIIVLCEDSQTDYFIRHFLMKNGWSRKGFKANFRTKIIHNGAGEQTVRTNYPNELKAIRAMRQRKNVALIVCTDADNITTEDRKKSLDEECEKNNVPKRQEDEPIFVFIPKRNIETWFAYLRGESVDEEQAKKYNKYPYESKCDTDILELTRMCNSKLLRPPVPPSLASACEEYEKLKSFKQELT